eukprot:6211995-Pleurochrysis_carterae.AAC.1
MRRKRMANAIESSALTPQTVCIAYNACAVQCAACGSGGGGVGRYIGCCGRHRCLARDGSDGDGDSCDKVPKFPRNLRVRSADFSQTKISI